MVYWVFLSVYPWYAHSAAVLFKVTGRTELRFLTAAGKGDEWRDTGERKRIRGEMGAGD